MSILVTGGKGFIGSRVIKKLLECQEKVVCMDLKTTSGRLGDLANRITMVEGDCSSMEQLETVIEEHDIKKIAHMVFFERHQIEQPEGLYRQMSVMIGGTFHIYELARKYGIKRVIYPSSIRYHGDQEPFGDRALTEESPSLATDIYGVGKHLAEALADEYNSLFGMEIIIVRVSGVYGPGIKIGAFGVNLIATEGGCGKPVNLPCPAEQKIVLVHVDDVAEIAVRLLLADKVMHTHYQVGGITTTFGELAHLGREFVPDMQISFSPSPQPVGPNMIDCSLMRKEVGVEHRPLKDGYFELINICRQDAGLPQIVRHE